MMLLNVNWLMVFEVMLILMMWLKLLLLLLFWISGFCMKLNSVLLLGEMVRFFMFLLVMCLLVLVNLMFLLGLSVLIVKVLGSV